MKIRLDHAPARNEIIRPCGCHIIDGRVVRFCAAGARIQAAAAASGAAKWRRRHDARSAAQQEHFGPA